MDRPKSSVSASVSRLEAQLGARLLQRTTRRVRPTEAGESLYQDAASMFHRLREVRADAMARAAKRSAARCASRRPTSSARTISARSLARCSRAIPSCASRWTWSMDAWIRIFALTRGVFAAPSLLARYRAPKQPEDLSELPALASPGDLEWTFNDASGAAYRVPIRPRMRSSNADVRRRAAIAGLGVARITSTFCQDAVRAGLLQELLPSYTPSPLPIYALLPGRRLMPPKVRIFLDALSATAGS